MAGTSTRSYAVLLTNLLNQLLHFLFQLFVLCLQIFDLLSQACNHSFFPGVHIILTKSSSEDWPRIRTENQKCAAYCYCVNPTSASLLMNVSGSRRSFVMVVNRTGNCPISTRILAAACAVITSLNAAQF